MKEIDRRVELSHRLSIISTVAAVLALVISLAGVAVAYREVQALEEQFEKSGAQMTVEAKFEVWKIGASRLKTIDRKEAIGPEDYSGQNIVLASVTISNTGRTPGGVTDVGFESGMQGPRLEFDSPLRWCKSGDSYATCATPFTIAPGEVKVVFLQVTPKIQAAMKCNRNFAESAWIYVEIPGGAAYHPEAPGHLDLGPC
ncbi:hypothetical protein HJ590_14415 [Naumannella sp. ID2617S]|nr:hypothetical protein [Naumannella sp. ID2617S]